MNPNADRANRSLLTLLALLLLAGAGAGLALSFGVFGRARARQPLLLPAAREFAHRNSGWFWLVVAVVAVVLGLLALRWLAHQLGTDRVRALDLEPDTRAGATTVHTAAVTDAVRAEVRGYRGVRGSAARLIGDAGSPELVLHVTLDDRADLAALRPRIEAQAVAHLRTAIDQPALPVHLQVQLAAGSARRVR